MEALEGSATGTQLMNLIDDKAEALVDRNKDLALKEIVNEFFSAEDN